MLKKIISAGICLAVAMSITFTASADKEEIKTITGWEGSALYYPEGNTDPLGVEYATGDAAISGKASLHVYGTKDNNNYNANAVQAVSGLEKGSKYRLTGKMKVSRDTWRVRLMFNEQALVQLGKITNSAGETITLNRVEDIDYTFEYNFSGNQFKLQVAGNGDVYADDLSLKKVIYDESGAVAGYGGELLTNGDFEADFAEPDEAEWISVAARNGANYIAVKTENPSVNIYSVGENGTTKLNLQTVAPSEYNCGSAPRYSINVYEHGGLENDRVYRYIIKTVGSNGVESSGREAFGIPSAKYDDYIRTNGWAYRHYGKNFGTVSYEAGIGTNSSGAMRITNMSDSSSNNIFIYIVNQKKIELQEGKIYKLTFKAKAGAHNTLADSFGIRMSNAYSSNDGTEFNARVNTDAKPIASISEQWQEYACWFKAEKTAENSFEIRINRHFEDLILDDFTLVEVGAENPANLFADKNGDFEDIELPEFKTEFEFYPAYNGDDGENEFGDIMAEQTIAALGELNDYDTDTVYARAKITNEVYTSGKSFVYVAAIYKDGALYDARSLASSAAYRPKGSSGEQFGTALRLPKAYKDVSVKVFVWDTLNGGLQPLGGCGSIGLR